MIRLLTVYLISAAIRSKADGSFQTGPSGGESSPFYNLLASSLLSKYAPLNYTTDPAPLSCTCGFCNQRNPYPPPPGHPGPPQSPTLVSGVVMFPTSELQQVLRAPVPLPLYGPSPHPPPNPQPDLPPSYIMSIPKKYAQQAPPPNTIQETYSSPPRNSMYSLPPPSHNPIPPHTYPYSPKPPSFASCPATVYFPTTQSLSFNQPSRHSYEPSPKATHSFPSYPPGPNYPPQLIPNFQMPVPLSPSTSPPPPGPKAVKDPMVTYTLRTATPTDVLPGSSLEAENKDCSVPTPPVLV